MEISGSTAQTFIFDTISGRQVKIAIYEIGDWNMDTDFEKNVYTPEMVGLEVIGVDVLIKNDDNTILTPLNKGRENAPYSDGRYSYYKTTDRIYMVRANAGVFDNANYDSTSYNRGYVYITYLI